MLNCADLEAVMTKPEQKAWKSFRHVVKGFLGNTKCENYQELVSDGVSKCMPSLHTDSMTHVTNGWKSSTKPTAVIDYNKNMRLVDKCDMQITALLSMRNSFKWYRKFSFYLVDVYRLNAFHLYKLSTGDDIRLNEFIYNVSMQLPEEFSEVSVEAGPQNAHISDNLDLRKHNLAEICRGFSGTVLRRRCVVCAKK